MAKRPRILTRTFSIDVPQELLERIGRIQEAITPLPSNQGTLLALLDFACALLEQHGSIEPLTQYLAARVGARAPHGFNRRDWSYTPVRMPDSSERAKARWRAAYRAKRAAEGHSPRVTYTSAEAAERKRQRNRVARAAGRTPEQIHDDHSRLTRAGMERARAEGKTIGRPRAVVDIDRALMLRGQGLSTPAIAKQLGVAQSTLYSALADAAAPQPQVRIIDISGTATGSGSVAARGKVVREI